VVSEVDHVLHIREVLLHHPVRVLQDPLLLLVVLLVAVLVHLVDMQEHVSVLQGLRGRGEALVQVVYEHDLLAERRTDAQGCGAVGDRGQVVEAGMRLVLVTELAASPRVVRNAAHVVGHGPDELTEDAGYLHVGGVHGRRRRLRHIVALHGEDGAAVDEEPYLGVAPVEDVHMGHHDPLELVAELRGVVGPPDHAVADLGGAEPVSGALGVHDREPQAQGLQGAPGDLRRVAGEELVEEEMGVSPAGRPERMPGPVVQIGHLGYLDGLLAAELRVRVVLGSVQEHVQDVAHCIFLRAMAACPTDTPPSPLGTCLCRTGTSSRDLTVSTNMRAMGAL